MSQRFLRACLLASLPFLCVTFSQAADQSFPYQAAVAGEQVDVRCGPGSQFYVTSRVKANEMVTVRRHDHGGWYMIDPPPGSLSWIEADCVQRTGADRGIINLSPEGGTPRPAVVRIGSQFSDEHSFSGRELSHGDEVAILGEETLTDARGSIRMLKIVPPAQEFRWVKGEFLVPTSQHVQQQVAVDPYQIPAEHRLRLATGGGALLMAPPAEGELQRSADVPSLETRAEPAAESPERLAEKQRLTEQFSTLRTLDQQYADMMSQPPERWDLDPIVNAYRKLKSESPENMGILIDQRLEVATKRQELAGHYRRFRSVTEEASRRDAQLLTGLEQKAPPVAEGALTVPGIPGGFPGVFGGTQNAMELPITVNPLTPMSGQLPAPPAVLNNSPPEAPQTQLVSGEMGGDAPLATPAGAEHPAIPVDPAQLVAKFTGAGIIQPVSPTPGFPAHVLLTPEGKLLAYLVPSEGVALNQWLGKGAGVWGPRTFDPRFGGDVIRVEGVTAVQLMK